MIFFQILVIIFSLSFLYYAEKISVKKTPKSVIEVYNKNTKKSEYKIKPGDRLYILFYRHPDLSTKINQNINPENSGVLVDKRGEIVLPLIGNVKVANFTEREVEYLLQKKYRRYVKNPQIYLEVTNKRLYVVGEVKRPGSILIKDSKISLIEALSKAGDITDFGERRDIYVLRGGLKNPEVIKVSIERPEDLALANIKLKPEDIVYVPSNRIKNINLAINGVLPLVNLVGEILSSIVDIKYLSQ